MAKGRLSNICRPLQPTSALLCKLGSIIAHVEEGTSIDAHSYDWQTVYVLLADAEVQAWLNDMNKLALLPVKRKIVQPVRIKEAKPVEVAVKQMRNLAMERKIKSGDAIDISKYQRDGKHYIVPKFVDDVDYCDANLEAWVWSIGRRRKDGVVLASLHADFYQNPEYECLWLR